MAERSLVIKVTAGKDDPERCNQAFTVAAAAVASGVPVSLWLTGESAWFALPGRAEDFSLPHAAPLADLLAGVLVAGTVTVCTQCAARRNITPEALIKGVRISGAATFVAEIMTGNAQALVYLRSDARPVVAEDPRLTEENESKTTSKFPSGIEFPLKPGHKVSLGSVGQAGLVMRRADP